MARSCCVVATLLGLLDVQIVIIVPLVIHLQLVHHAHEDDAVGVRLRRELLTKVVDGRRNLMLGLGQQLLGGECWIDVDLAVRGICQ